MTNAIKFIKDHGVDKAREVLSGAKERNFYFPSTELYSSARPFQEDFGNTVIIEDLKRLVESVDLIKKHGGLFSAKCQLDKGGIDFEWYGENGEFGLTDLEDLKQAITDYEAIGGEHV